MHKSDDSAGYLDYRVYERDRIELREIGVVPDPARLRLACLMIYAGLLLSLGAMLASGPAVATADDCQVAVRCATGTRSENVRELLPAGIPGSASKRIGASPVPRIDRFGMDRQYLWPVRSSQIPIAPAL